MKAGAGGLPDPARIETFQLGPRPIDLLFGPGGDLYYISIATGSIRRIRYFTGNTPPSAHAEATPSHGPLPLEVTFDATGSRDRDPGATLSYAWDLDDDGEFDDSSASNPTETFIANGTYRVTLRATDENNATDTDSVTVSAGNTPPEVTIEGPSSSVNWKVGDQLAFTGSAYDPQDGLLGASAFDWQLVLHHCPAGGPCHPHPIRSFENVTAGSLVAPEHEYPSYLELEVSVTDSGGLSDSEKVRLDPTTVELTIASEPTGLELTHNDESRRTPFTRTVIRGATSSISAPSPQTLLGTTWLLESWSDGGNASHNVVLDSDATYEARYHAAP